MSLRPLWLYALLLRQGDQYSMESLLNSDVFLVKFGSLSRFMCWRMNLSRSIWAARILYCFSLPALCPMTVCFFFPSLTCRHITHQPSCLGECISPLNGPGKMALCAEKVKVLQYLSLFQSICCYGIGGFTECFKTTLYSMANSEFLCCNLD